MQTRCVLDDREEITVKLSPGQSLQRLIDLVASMNEVSPGTTLVCCLESRDGRLGFGSMIYLLPASPPHTLYFYSLCQQLQKTHFTHVSVSELNNFKDPPIKLLLSKTHEVKHMDEVYKSKRQDQGKCGFIYEHAGRQIGLNTTLSSLNQEVLELVAVPKLIDLIIHIEEDEARFQIGPTHFRRSAREMLDRVICKQINRKPAEFLNCEVFFEYEHYRIPEEERVSPRPRDEVKLHVVDPRREIKDKVEVTVVDARNQKKVSKGFSLRLLKYKIPSEIASLVGPLKANAKYTALVDNNDHLDSLDFFVAGKSVRIDVSWLPLRSRIPSQKDSKASNKPVEAKIDEFVSLKSQLKALLTEKNSPQVDERMLALIGDFMMGRMLD